MWNYSKKTMDHFLNPRNMGEIKDADAVGEIGNIVCGDALKLYLKLDKNEKIVDARFQTFGCASAIASSSALTEMIKGMTLAEASRVTDDDIAKYLEGLPEEKMHCSVMGRDALDKAIALYRGQPYKDEETEVRLICKCFGVTDRKIIEVVKKHNLKTVEEITHFTKAGGGCGKCIPDIQALLDEYWNKKGQKSAAAKEGRPLTNIQKIKLVEEVIEKEIQPQLARDGGGLELKDIDRNIVYIKFMGACSGCRASGATLTNFVQEKLREHVSQDMVVVEVKEA